MNKAIRKKVYQKYDGHCAYCGRLLETIEQMQVDHIVPKCLGGANTIDNLNPSCRMCNHYKRSMTVDKFRNQIKTLKSRLEKIYIYRVAVDFGIASIKPWDGRFYFESEEQAENRK